MPDPNEYHADDSNDKEKDHMSSDDISILKQLGNAPVVSQASATPVKKTGIDHVIHEFYSSQNIFIAAMASIQSALPRELTKALKWKYHLNSYDLFLYH